jgi:hypothetical protein
MGPTALLPLRRRATDFVTLKIHRPRPGLNPRTLDPVASTLPLDHRGRHYPCIDSYFYQKSKLVRYFYKILLINVLR